jgi:hypothetical protein
MVQASIVGLFKTTFIIIGAIVVLRFIGQLLIAKRNLEDERKLNARQRDFEKERNRKLKNFGKVQLDSQTINKKKYSKNENSTEIEDVDFEEIN